MSRCLSNRLHENVHERCLHPVVTGIQATAQPVEWDNLRASVSTDCNWYIWEPDFTIYPHGQDLTLFFPEIVESAIPKLEEGLGTDISQQIHSQLKGMRATIGAQQQLICEQENQLKKLSQTSEHYCGEATKFRILYFHQCEMYERLMAMLVNGQEQQGQNLTFIEIPTLEEASGLDLFFLASKIRIKDGMNDKPFRLRYDPKRPCLPCSHPSRNGTWTLYMFSASLKIVSCAVLSLSSKESRGNGLKHTILSLEPKNWSWLLGSPKLIQRVYRGAYAMAQWMTQLRDPVVVECGLHGYIMSVCALNLDLDSLSLTLTVPILFPCQDENLAHPRPQAQGHPPASGNRRKREASDNIALIENGLRRDHEAMNIQQRGQMRVQRHIIEYNIPDSDLDDSDEEIGCHEPRKEENHKEKAEKHVRFAGGAGESFETETGLNIHFSVTKARAIAVEPDVNDDSEGYHHAEASNNTALGLNAIRVRNDLGPPGVTVYGDQRDWTTALHIFLGGCLFGIMIAGVIFAAWISGLRHSEAWRIDPRL
ncbi:hypothetical protein BKA70DRAFT_1227596 [Coprinopsis sp. MPI-PUGE-AT-0042]|nr:hypothetical protein BKA70DRAFT_1227596 [Coprinopsis sp. MPI-PUGE-AT-0042]